MRLLFDTNVLIAAFLKGDSPFKVIERALLDHEVYYTDFILSEFSRIFLKKFKFPEETVERFVNYIERVFIKGGSSPTLEKICRDPDDDQVLADSLENDIDIIITGDKDLLILKKYEGIRIIQPKDFWNL